MMGLVFPVREIRFHYVQRCCSVRTEISAEYSSSAPAVIQLLQAGSQSLDSWLSSSWGADWQHLRHHWLQTRVNSTSRISCLALVGARFIMGALSSAAHPTNVSPTENNRQPHANSQSACLRGTLLLCMLGQTQEGCGTNTAKGRENAAPGPPGPRDWTEGVVPRHLQSTAGAPAFRFSGSL